MVIQLVLADDDKPTFALLTKLHLSETVITDDEGGYILELVSIYSCVRELTIHTSSLLTLFLVSVNDLQWLEVDAANLTKMQVKDCFVIELKDSAMSLSMPAMEEFC
uniref:Uncharacterized protein n=1 Tax=Oryza nivara TaxID=4536 RepID=A0A0E0I226_ORYNI